MKVAKYQMIRFTSLKDGTGDLKNFVMMQFSVLILFP